MTIGCLRAATRIVDSGFRVYLPLFAHPGTDDGALSIIEGALSPTLCIRHEFNSSPPMDTAASPAGSASYAASPTPNAEIAASASSACVSPETSCFGVPTPPVRVPVMCEPAIPFFNKAALGVPKKDIDDAGHSLGFGPILAFRFTTDTKCPPGAVSSPFAVPSAATSLLPNLTGKDNPFNIPNGSHLFWFARLPASGRPQSPRTARLRPDTPSSLQNISDSKSIFHATFQAGYRLRSSLTTPAPETSRRRILRALVPRIPIWQRGNNAMSTNSTDGPSQLGSCSFSLAYLYRRALIRGVAASLFFASQRGGHRPLHLRASSSAE